MVKFIGLLLLLTFSFVCSETPKWSLLKPFNKGDVYELGADAEGTLFCRSSGIWKSTDNGLTWVPAQGNLSTMSIRKMEVDPLRPGVVFVSTGQGLYKTNDGGLTWYNSGIGLPSVNIGSIVIDPINSSTIYIGTSNGLFKSTDGGASWSLKNSGLQLSWWPGGEYSISGLAVDPVNPQRLYANTYRSYVHTSTNGADSWNSVLSLWGNKIHVAPSSPNMVYITHWHGDWAGFRYYPIIRSTNHGASWHTITPPVSSTDDVYTVGIHPQDHNLLFASMYKGLYKSDNAGSSWTPSLLNPGIRNVYSVTFEQSSPGNIFANTAQGVYFSQDNGTVWEERSSGIASAIVSDLDVNSSNPGRIYAVVRHEGLLKSADAGITWQSIGFAGIPINDVANHPNDPDVLIANYWDESIKKGLWKSGDGGQNWQACQANFRIPTGAGRLVFHPLDPSKVFGTLADWVGGVAMSTDGGNSWFNPQFQYVYTRKYAFHPTDANKIWVGYSRYWGRPTNRMGVLYSTNGGHNWGRVEFGYGSVNDIAIDKDNPQIMYAACSDGIWGGIDYSGVWKSTNGGFNWVKKNSGLGNTQMLELVFDAFSGKLFAATEGGVYCTQDGADTWHTISSVTDIPHQMVRSMDLTPDGTRLYVGTNGGIYSYFPEGVPEYNTPVGTSVEVNPVYEETGNPSPITLVFASVTTAGNTTVSTTAGPPPDGALELFPPDTYYDIATTAAYTGAIDISIYYGWTGITPEEEQKLRLIQYQDESWVDITVEIDVQNNVIRGNTASLGLFGVILLVDDNPPHITVTGVSDGSYYNTDVIPIIDISDDESGVKTYNITLNGAPFTSGTPVSEEGQYILAVSAEDYAGNELSVAVSFVIDKTVPVINISGITEGADFTDEVTPYITISDELSGMENESLTLDGIPYVSENPITTKGHHQIIAIGFDKAGNENMKTVNFSIYHTTFLTVSATAGQYSDNTVLTATLQSHGNPVIGKNITFTVNGAEVATAVTDESGTALLHHKLELAAGTYNISSGFAQDDEDFYRASSASNQLAVTAEDATILYTGDLLVAYPAPVTLRAQISQSADGSLGDLSLAIVRFDLLQLNSDGTKTPAGSYTANSDVSGIAETIQNLGVGVYTIITSIVEEGWFVPAVSEAFMPVYDPSGGMATGGGWIDVTDPGDGNPGRANFGFIAKYKDDHATGNLEFQYKDDNLNMKSKSIDWLVISNISAQFKGTAIIKGWPGEYTFRVNCTDNKGNPQADKFTIKIWTGSDTMVEPVYKALNQDLAGGNILVKKQ